MESNVKIFSAYAGKVVSVREYSKNATIEAFVKDREAIAASLGVETREIVCDTDQERACAWSLGYGV